MPGVEAGDSDPNRSKQPSEGLAEIVRAFHNSRQQEIVDPEILSAVSRKIIAAVAATATNALAPTVDDMTRWWEIEPGDRDPNDYRWNT